MSHRAPIVAGVGVAALLLLAPSLPSPAPPSPPDAASGDVVAGAEPAGVDATEWEALVRGSATAQQKGGLDALLESPNVDQVVLYKNLNRSTAVDEDDAYHLFARRCGIRTTLVEDCADADVVYDHVVFQRHPTTDGRYAYEILAVTAERPVGTALAIPGVNPLGAPHGPGPVSVADRDDPRRDPRALATLADEIAAGSQQVDESGEATVGVVRDFTPPEHTTYPNAYERLSVVFDDSDAPDLYYVPTPSGASPRGTHGALSVTQSRTTLLVSGRGARRTPLDPAEEAAAEIHNVDVAPTVAKVLGIPEHTAARYLNDGGAAENPAAAPARLLRQDGKPVDALLEPRVNTFVIVLDGMIPENVNATDTPNLCNLIDCPGAASPHPTARATAYEQARAVMVTQTNANHAAMMTGAYGAANGIVANSFHDRTLPGEVDTTDPALIRVDTLFDVLRRDLPHLRTAAVMGKSKLRELFDCTNDGAGSCIEGDTGNPEGEPVTHVRPDYLRGASESPDPLVDCPAEPASGSGVALDACVMDLVIELSATEDPDFTFVNLGMIDALQHLTGPNSPVSDAAVTLADAQIGRLVAYLEESGKWEHSVLFVVADHSFSWQDTPATGLTQRVDLDAAFAAACPGAGYQLVSSGGTAHVHLDGVGLAATALTPAQEAAIACLRGAALAQTGVIEAWYRLPNAADGGTAHTLGAARPEWGLDDARAGDLVIAALASGPQTGLGNPVPTGVAPWETTGEDPLGLGRGYTLNAATSTGGLLPGDHGHPGARHIPFYVISGGDFVVDQVVGAASAPSEGDDTALDPGQAENVDIAPTVAWLYGLDPATALPDAEGRVLGEAFSERPIEAVEPHANRAIVFIFDGNNSVRIHDLMADCDDASCGDPLNLPVPALRDLLWEDTDARSGVPVGTLTAFGSISAMPTVTFPNHNVLGSGVYPAHHGIVGNSYYERDVATERDPIDQADPRNPLFFFSSALLRADFETLHEAVHRGFGDWSPAEPGGAFTASVNEPSARGADFASLETVSSEALPATFAGLVANAPEFLEDTTLQPCAEDSPDGYGLESVLDHLGQAQARQLFAEASTGGLARPAGLEPLIADDSLGAAHPDPKYLIANFTLTDGSGHEFGPHGACARAGYRDTASRLGHILAELDNHARFALLGEPARRGETFVLLTGDHGMENQDLRPGENGGFDAIPTQYDIEYVRQGDFVYLLTMDVAIDGPPWEAGVESTHIVTVTDADLLPDGSAAPIEGATVEVVAGSGSAAGVTDANGQVALTLTPTGDSATVRVDLDPTPAAGGRTLGSESPDPLTHGLVAKTAYNDRVITLPEPGARAALAALVAALAGLARRRRAAR